MATEERYCSDRRCGGVINPATGKCWDCGRPEVASTPDRQADVEREASFPEKPAGQESRSNDLPASLREQYEVVETLGNPGVEAVVFRVRDRESGETRVVKRYSNAARPKEGVLELLRQVPFEHAVRLHEFGEETPDHGASYFWELQEYCAHGSLRALLNDVEHAQLDLNALAEIVEEMYTALRALHGVGDGAGIVHRDLKPENVFIRTREPLDLVLGDYGASSVLESTGRWSMGGGGTPAYMAPEVLHEGEGVTVTRAADYWSLGIIVYEVLTGDTPFHGMTIGAVLRQIAREPIDIAVIDDERWRLLCSGLLCADPENRWQADQVAGWLTWYDETKGNPDLEIPEELRPLTNDDRLWPQSVTPLTIAGTPCHGLVQVGEALSEDWEAAVQFALDPNILTTWILNELKGYDVAKSISDLANSELDRRLVAGLVIMELDPGRPLTLRGRSLDPKRGLLELASAARDGDSEAEEIVRLLEETDALEVVGNRHQSYESWEPVGRRWGAACESIKTVAGSVPGPFRSSLRSPKAKAELLAVCASNEFGESVLKAADEYLDPAGYQESFLAKLGWATGRRPPNSYLAEQCNWFRSAILGARVAGGSAEDERRGRKLATGFAAQLLGEAAAEEAFSQLRNDWREKNATALLLGKRCVAGAGTGWAASLFLVGALLSGPESLKGVLGFLIVIVAVVVGALIFADEGVGSQIAGGCGGFLVGSVAAAVIGGIFGWILGGTLTRLSEGWAAMGGLQQAWHLLRLWAPLMLAGAIVAVKWPEFTLPHPSRAPAVIIGAGSVVVLASLWAAGSSLGAIYSTKRSRVTQSTHSTSNTGPATVTDHGTRLRAGPSTDSIVKENLAAGQVVQPIRIAGNWVHVEVFDGGERGWVARRLLRASDGVWRSLDQEPSEGNVVFTPVGNDMLAIQAPELPREVASALDERGLRIPGQLYKYCFGTEGPSTHPFFVTGDFDGDEQEDYAVKGETSPRRGSILILMGTGEIHEIPGWQMIGMVKRGETIGSSWMEPRSLRLENDGLEGIQCESSSAVYVYNHESDSFDRYQTSD